jgi:DNA-directed RNA polymerase I, II, and III subunit RPABC2
MIFFHGAHQFDYDDYENENLNADQEMEPTQEQDAVMILEENTVNGAANQQGGENKEKTTTPYMTKYERARILGTRALQIR